MASMFISCASLGLASPSCCTWGTNKAAFKKQLYSTQPATMAAATTNSPIVRRSGNYPPSPWSYDYLQSLTNNYVGEKYKTASNSLKERVRTMITKDIAVEKPLSALELVDDLQRLGISYHFKDEISSVLKMVYNCYYEDHEKWDTLDLNLKALGFRLLRQHGYQIPQEIFEDIKDETGKVRACVCEDVVGMLNLYEASFLAVDDENILDEAREFTTKCLKEKLDQKNMVSNESNLLMLISHALELPLNWRIPRFEAMWFIETYSGRSDMRPLLLELAKLDYNIVQGVHLEDVQYLSRWWDGLGWDKKLSFARDRLVLSFMWAIAANSEPPLGVIRKVVTKSICLITVIDDIYDVYGTLDELERFTDIMRRWDINDLEGLPYYLKTCFLGFYNTINDLTYDTLKNQESLVVPYMKKAWANYCEANLLEARWFNSGYTPTLEEYLNNSCITISLPVIVSSAYILATSSDITEKSLKNIVHWSAMILRLADDLGTSTAELERGDIPKSIQCYMHESGASEEEARDYIKKLIMETWKKLNKERMDLKSPSASWIFVECATNLGRMAQFIYQRGDGYGSPDDVFNSDVTSLLFNPKN